MSILFANSCAKISKRQRFLKIEVLHRVYRNIANIIFLMSYYIGEIKISFPRLNIFKI